MPDLIHYLNAPFKFVHTQADDFKNRIQGITFKEAKLNKKQKQYSKDEKSLTKEAQKYTAKENPNQPWYQKRLNWLEPKKLNYKDRVKRLYASSDQELAELKRVASTKQVQEQRPIDYKKLMLGMALLEECRNDKKKIPLYKRILFGEILPANKDLRKKTDMAASLIVQSSINPDLTVDDIKRSVATGGSKMYLSNLPCAMVRRLGWFMMNAAPIAKHVASDVANTIVLTGLGTALAGLFAGRITYSWLIDRDRGRDHIKSAHGMMTEAHVEENKTDITKALKALQLKKTVYVQVGQLAKQVQAVIGQLSNAQINTPKKCIVFYEKNAENLANNLYKLANCIQQTREKLAKKGKQDATLELEASNISTLLEKLNTLDASIKLDNNSVTEEEKASLIIHLYENTDAIVKNLQQDFIHVEANLKNALYRKHAEAASLKRYRRVGYVVSALKLAVMGGNAIAYGLAAPTAGASLAGSAIFAGIAGAISIAELYATYRVLGSDYASMAKTSILSAIKTARFLGKDGDDHKAKQALLLEQFKTDTQFSRYFIGKSEHKRLNLDKLQEVINNEDLFTDLEIMEKAQQQAKVVSPTYKVGSVLTELQNQSIEIPEHEEARELEIFEDALETPADEIDEEVEVFEDALETPVDTIYSDNEAFNDLLKPVVNVSTLKNLWQSNEAFRVQEANRFVQYKIANYTKQMAEQIENLKFKFAKKDLSKPKQKENLQKALVELQISLNTLTEKMQTYYADAQALKAMQANPVKFFAENSEFVFKTDEITSIMLAKYDAASLISQAKTASSDRLFERFLQVTFAPLLPVLGFAVVDVFNSGLMSDASHAGQDASLLKAVNADEKFGAIAINELVLRLWFNDSIPQGFAAQFTEKKKVGKLAQTPVSSVKPQDIDYQSKTLTPLTKTTKVKVKPQAIQLIDDLLSLLNKKNSTAQVKIERALRQAKTGLIEDALKAGAEKQANMQTLTKQKDSKLHQTWRILKAIATPISNLVGEIQANICLNNTQVMRKNLAAYALMKQKIG